MAMPGTPTPEPAVSGPPPGWETPAVTVESFTPTLGPVNDETATDRDYIEAAAPSSPDTDNMNDDTIGGTVQQSVMLVMDNYGAREERTHAQGQHLGELVDLPPGPDADSSKLQTVPGDTD